MVSGLSVVTEQLPAATSPRLHRCTLCAHAAALHTSELLSLLCPLSWEGVRALWARLAAPGGVPWEAPRPEGRLRVTAEGGGFAVGLKGRQVWTRAAGSGSRCRAPRPRVWGAEVPGLGGHPRSTSHPRQPSGRGRDWPQSQALWGSDVCQAVTEILRPSWRRPFPEPTPSGPSAGCLMFPLSFLTLHGGRSGPDGRLHC